MKTIDEVREVFRAIRKADLDCQSVFPCVDSETGEPKVCVIVNDVFLWGCSDLEDIEPADIPTLLSAYEDLREIKGKDWEYAAMDVWTHVLYAARKRGMRPQGAYYKHIDREAWPLLNACGPHREACFGNPAATPNADGGAV